MQATLFRRFAEWENMVELTPPETMKIDERLDEIASMLNLAVARLKEKAELAGYKRLSEYLVVLEKERRRNSCELI
jgi:hypothetical protein